MSPTIRSGPDHARERSLGSARTARVQAQQIVDAADRPDGGVRTPIHTERVERRDLESEHFPAS